MPFFRMCDLSPAKLWEYWANNAMINIFQRHLFQSAYILNSAYKFKRYLIYKPTQKKSENMVFCTIYNALPYNLENKTWMGHMLSEFFHFIYLVRFNHVVDASHKKLMLNYWRFSRKDWKTIYLGWNEVSRLGQGIGLEVLQGFFQSYDSIILFTFFF